CDGGFVGPVGESDLFAVFSDGMEGETTELTEREVAHAQRNLFVFIVVGTNPGAEDHDVHGLSLSIIDAGHEPARGYLALTVFTPSLVASSSTSAGRSAKRPLVTTPAI